MSIVTSERAKVGMDNVKIKPLLSYFYQNLNEEEYERSSSIFDQSEISYFYQITISLFLN